ncbi:hypothetical protein PAMP_004619 [Pampus punctatissimus]
MAVDFPASDLSYQRGVRYTYRYSTTITTTLHGSNAGRNGLALDCVVDIDVVSKCHLTMQIRNPQIKRLSPQKEHSVQRLKSLRESLERTRLKFSLRGGKVTALCLQEGEQVWALNIKRALLSMLQTSRMASKQELVKETDVYGTCTSKYERRGPVLLKIRNLKQCQQSRLANFWPQSVAVTDDTSVQSELHCVQRHGSTVMEEVNCTEVVSMATLSSTAGLVKTQTVSTLLLLRAQPGTPSGTDSLVVGVLTDLQFEEEGAVQPGKAKLSTPQQASQTVRMLCSLTSDPQLVSQQFLQLAFQLRDLTPSQLKTLWQDASFKCRNDWQPLLDALPACGSENCIVLLTDLMKNKELEDDQAHSFLTTISLIPHPSPQIIDSINDLVKVPELRSKALLAGSSLVYQLCQRSSTSCSDLPQVQTFIQMLEETLSDGCKGEEPTQVRELVYALKSVGNTGLSASSFIPLLNRCMLRHSTALELRLAAVQAFRRFPCTVDRSVLLQLYCSSQEDPEVRIAAYQQLMRCPDQDVFEVVRTTLRSESSSQVGSFVWSHLTNVLRSEDPMKQALIESLPDDIISRDFEAEYLKYSSYSDYTVTSGMGIANVETSLVFSSKSFLPRSATANLTVYFHGRAHNLLEVELHVDNAEPLLRSIFGHQTSNSDADSKTAQSQKHAQSKEAKRTIRKTDDGRRGEKETCLTNTNTYLNQARAMLFGRRKMEKNMPKCLVGVKVFGNELNVFTCGDLYNQINQLSLSAAGLAVRLLKGHEVQLNHRVVLMTEELVLPSLSGLPIKLGINMTSLLSLHLKGNANYRDTSHFSLTGYIKPNFIAATTLMFDDKLRPSLWLYQWRVTSVYVLSAYVGLSARMGVDGALGQSAVNWISELRSSTSLDGSVQLQEGQDLRVTLNTPEDVMDIMSLNSRVFQLSGDHREEIKGPKSRIQKTTCTPKTWSKMVGWQLCSNASYPLAAVGISLPPSGPVHLSLRLLKLDRGLHHYLLEAAYSLLPQSSIPRDMSLDLAFNPHRLLLKITHPLKTIVIQGQLEQERNIKTGKLELLIDSTLYYIMGLVDTQTFMSEQRTRYHFEAKMAADGHPMILSANVTRGLGSKTSFSATVKNVFKETASLSVALERRRDSSSRQYSVEVELLLPGVVGSRMLGLMEQKGSLWSSALRLKYGLGGDARHLRQECHTSQRLRSERDANLTYIMRADHEFYCSNAAPINHKIHLRHEESPSHVKSSLDMSYGKHWDEMNNKRTLLLSQSFKNQSTQNHTSYTLEFSLQVPEKNLNYRTQLLHSHLRQPESESSTHLKVNYNNLMPLVAGLHWKGPSKNALQKKWEGTFNMDTPWLYIYTTHKLSQHQRHTLQLTSELTASKWLTIRNLILEAFYRVRGREREGRLELYTPAVTYLQAEAWGVVGKRNVKASCSLRSLWTAPLRGDVSLEASKFSHTLQLASSYSKHNVNLTAALNTVDKNLKKKQVIVRMSVSEPKSQPTELEFEGAVEELKKDKKMYQKTAMLQLSDTISHRQPFQTFPQSLLLRETFTIDLLKGLYILESRAGFHSNKEVIHTLTLGYQPPSPFVCSALIHPFSSDTIPSDSEICVTISNNQTHKDIHGRLRVCSKERLAFFGQVQLNSSHQALKVKANLTHQLQLQLPSSVIVEGDVCWNPKSNTDFDYVARGKLRIERQECQAKATADISTEAGIGSSSLHVKADGKVQMMLDAQMSHFLQHGDRAVGLRLNLSQSLLPAVTDMHVNMAANMSSNRCLLDVSLLLKITASYIRVTPLGVPVSSSAQVRWFQDGGELSVLAELQAGPEYLKAEFNGGRTEQLIPRWQYLSRLQHQFKALLIRGISSSVQAKAHYQLDTKGLDIGLVLHMDDENMADILFTVGSKNSTAILVLSLWQQMKLLQGFVPASLQMNCTGDVTADRLSAQCYGNVAGRPVEVRAFRSYRPHNRLCYGLSLIHINLSAQAKGCFSPNGQKELRANLTHSSVLLLTVLGVPSKTGLSLLLRPGPHRWALGTGLAVGPWRMDMNVGLRAEKSGVYGWHGLLEYGGGSVTNKAELTGRVRLESWCHMWADIGMTWDSVSSTLLVSVRCNGVGRLVWEQVRRVEDGVPHKSSLTIHGQAGKDGLRGSLGLENQQDSLHSLLSVLLKDHKAEVGWTLQHRWASLTPIIPHRVHLQGSGQLHNTSLLGSAQVSFNTHSTQIDITAAWEPFTSFRVTLQQNVATTGVPGLVTVSMLSTTSQAQFKVESDMCSVLLLANQQRRGAEKRTSWNVFVHQRCVLLKTLLPPQTSFNISIIRSGCSTNLTAVLQAEDEHNVSLTLSLTCHPSLSLKASVQHSVDAIQTLGFPTHGALILRVSSAHLSEVEVGLELGRCYFRGNLEKTTSSETETERNQSSYAVNVTNYCPALQGTVLPVSLVLQSLLSVSPCLMTVASFLRADNQDLTVELRQSCTSPHLSGTFKHTFPGLTSRGLPQTITVEATAPGSTEQAGSLLIKVGRCHIRASRVVEAKRRTKWVWALESKCPMLQAHLNGSVWQEAQGIWAAVVDTHLGGKGGFLRLNARAWPELSLEGEFNHNLPALRSVPEHSRLRVTSRAGKHHYDTEALIQMGKCAVRASGNVTSHPVLQGSLMYYNNCTVIQEWGSPDRMQASGSLVVSPTLAESHMSIAIDNAELQALVALKKTKNKNEASLYLNHTVPLLKKLGLTANAAIAMNSGHHGNQSYYYLLHSSAGKQKLNQEMTVEKMSGTVRVKSDFRHTLNYLKKLGVPGNSSVQGLCSIQGPIQSLQSRAQLTVDGHKLLVSGFNVSMSGGRLAALLSYSPLASNQTGTQFSLDSALTAQFKGPLRSTSVDVHCQDWRVRMVGDVGGWGAHGGSKEARVTLKHTVQGRSSPVLQLNQSQSSVAGVVEMSSGRRRLWALGEVAAIKSGYRQALELKHSYPQITSIPRWTSLEVTLERSLLGQLDSVLLGWTRHGRLEQVRALSLWSRSEEMNETKLELKQPFSSTLSQLSLHTLSYSSQREQRSSHQKGPRGMHSLQVNVGLDKVSPAPCSSHTLLAKVQTNLRDRFEHTVLLGLCPPQPVQARLDRREKIWLNGTVEGKCLQTTAGYNNGSGLNEDISVVACVGTNHGLMLDVQKRDSDNKPENLGSVSVGTTNQRLMLRASGCLESLTAAEAHIHYLSSRIQRKMLERIKTIQNLLTEFRRQSRASALLQELSAVPLHVSQRAEAILAQKDRGLLTLWQNSPLRRIWTDNLPRFLRLLQHTSLLGQQELRRPLATLAGVYQDVRGQRLEALWREAVSLWTDWLVEVLPALLENPQLRPLAQASVATLSIALDAAGQHTYHWVESRLAMALSGVRKRLTSVYKFSPSECSVTVSVPLPLLPWSRIGEAGLMEILLEEWLLRPLQTLASIRPTAELYRLKRKIIDSPFIYQALLVADQFVVTFDGHLYELPDSCPLLLSQDISADPSFTLMLGSDSHNFLLLGMNNSTINIHHNGQVKTNCNNTVTHTFHSDSGVAVIRGSNIVKVSNQNGVSVSCDLTLEVCSFTLDGWLHGMSTGLLGSNDNEAGNDFILPNGSQAENLKDFLYSWQMKPECIRPPATTEHLSKAAKSPVTCNFLFSSPDSPLSSCFRVVDPGQFLLVCEWSSSRAPCRLASAFVHLCQRNYIPLEVPVQCLKV